MNKLKVDLKFPIIDPNSNQLITNFEFDLPSVEDMIHAEESSKGKNGHHYNAMLFSLTSGGTNPSLFLKLKQPDYLNLVEESRSFFQTGEILNKSEKLPIGSVAPLIPV